MAQNCIKLTIPNLRMQDIIIIDQATFYDYYYCCVNFLLQAEISATGSSTLFQPIESRINGLSYFKLQTTVQRQSSGTSGSTAGIPQPSLQDATCYIAVNDFLTGEPPRNVCNVPGNSFAFDDEDSLLFQIDLSNAYGFGFGR